jgi:hypothetical protein
LAGGEPGVAELEAEVAGHGELGQEIVAQGKLRFDGTDVVRELAGEGFTLGAGAGGGTDGGAELFPERVERVELGLGEIFRGGRGRAGEKWLGCVEDGGADAGEGKIVMTARMLSESCGIRYWEDYVFFRELRETKVVLSWCAESIFPGPQRTESGERQLGSDTAGE